MLERIEKLEEKVRWLYCRLSEIVSSGIQSIQAGRNITIDNTDPLNPIVHADIEMQTGGGIVDSVQAGTNVTVNSTDPRNPIVSSTTTEPRTYQFVVTKGAGAFEEGDIFPGGLTLGQAFEALLTGVYVPSFVAPSFSMSTNGGIKEVGATIDLTLTGVFNRGQIKGIRNNGVWNPNMIQNPRSGLPSKYSLNGQETNTSELTHTRVISGYVVKLGDNNFTGGVNYMQGPQPKDSEGADYSTPLPAGTLTGSAVFTGLYRKFAGPMSYIPEVGSQIRQDLLSTSVLNNSNTYSFKTGTVERRFVIAIPADKNIVSVINPSTTENYTSGFILTGITSVPDAGGTLRPYKVFMMENAIAFSQNYTINITIN